MLHLADMGLDGGRKEDNEDSEGVAGVWKEDDNDNIG